MTTATPTTLPLVPCLFAPKPPHQETKIPQTSMPHSAATLVGQQEMLSLSGFCFAVHLVVPTREAHVFGFCRCTLKHTDKPHSATHDSRHSILSASLGGNLPVNILHPRSYPAPVWPKTAGGSASPVLHEISAELGMASRVGFSVRPYEPEKLLAHAQSLLRGLGLAQLHCFRVEVAGLPRMNAEPRYGVPGKAARTFQELGLGPQDWTGKRAVQMLR